MRIRNTEALSTAQGALSAQDAQRAIGDGSELKRLLVAQPLNDVVRFEVKPLCIRSHDGLPGADLHRGEKETLNRQGYVQKDIS